jgi:TatD DNase family protein
MNGLEIRRTARYLGFESRLLLHMESTKRFKMLWIDTHCHLDAAEFHEFHSVAGVLRADAAIKKVAHCVYPAVHPANFKAVRELAHAHGDSYALGVHPLYVKDAPEHDLKLLDEELAERVADPRLVAVGEIGLDFFVPELKISPLREKQIHFYREQLKLAKKYDLPVVVHVRQSADVLLKGLRDFAAQNYQWRGIIHAFNGSDSQAAAFIKLGFKLGFGGAMTFDRALQLRSWRAARPQRARAAAAYRAGAGGLAGHQLGGFVADGLGEFFSRIA